VTEIPEHLLKRSKERRAAAGGTGGTDSADAPASSTPATVDAASPAVAAKASAPAKAAPAAPAPPKPDPAYIAAAKTRKKIPFWAMATLSLLPIWGFMYVQGLKPQLHEATGPIADGVVVYAGCATCHGSTGAGGVGRPFIGGSLQKTFPHIEDQLNLVYTGSQAYKDSGVGPYGDASLGHLGFNGNFMPLQGTKKGGALTDAQILAVVCHERYDLAGADPTSTQWAAEYTLWCSPDSKIYAALKGGSATFDNLDSVFKADKVLPVGTAPRPGTPAGK
jgi:mono/diheme cytochrome c family protein